jgi:hypothetical protein
MKEERGRMTPARCADSINEQRVTRNAHVASRFTDPHLTERQDERARPGRIGAHSSHKNITPVYYQRILLIAHFNAGVSALDILDPFRPREIVYYVPASGW